MCKFLTTDWYISGIHLRCNSWRNIWRSPGISPGIDSQIPVKLHWQLRLTSTGNCSRPTHPKRCRLNLNAVTPSVAYGFVEALAPKQAKDHSHCEQGGERLHWTILKWLLWIGRGRSSPVLSPCIVPLHFLLHRCKKLPCTVKPNLVTMCSASSVV